MTALNLKSFAFAGILAAGSFLMAVSGSSATPAAGSIAASGLSDIIREASQVTQVRRRGRHRRHRHRRGRRFRHGYYYGGPFIGFGAPYFYGGYPYGYYNGYYRPRVRRSYRGSRSCRRAHRACVRRWGYGGGNYAGCMKYEGCRPR